MGQLSGVKGSWGKAVEFLGDRFGRQKARVSQFPALDFFRKERGGGDGGRAAATEKSDFANPLAVQNRCQLENVPADGIADFDFDRGAGEFAGIARVLEMVEQRIAEHAEKYSSER